MRARRREAHLQLGVSPALLGCTMLCALYAMLSRKRATARGCQRAAPGAAEQVPGQAGVTK